MVDWSLSERKKDEEEELYFAIRYNGDGKEEKYFRIVPQFFNPVRSFLILFTAIDREMKTLQTFAHPPHLKNICIRMKKKKKKSRYKCDKNTQSK